MKVLKVSEWLDTQPDGACWEWPYSKDRHGYGRTRFDGRSQGAHRVVYQLLVGQIPDGLDLDHLCRTPACVNPAHLEPVTRRENLLRGNHLTMVTRREQRCQRGHSLVEGSPHVYPRKDRPGSRECRTCRNEARRKWGERQ